MAERARNIYPQEAKLQVPGVNLKYSKVSHLGEGLHLYIKAPGQPRTKRQELGTTLNLFHGAENSS